MIINSKVKLIFERIFSFKDEDRNKENEDTDATPEVSDEEDSLRCKKCNYFQADNIQELEDHMKLHEEGRKAHLRSLEKKNHKNFNRLRITREKERKMRRNNRPDTLPSTLAVGALSGARLCDEHAGPSGLSNNNTGESSDDTAWVVGQGDSSDEPLSVHDTVRNSDDELETDLEDLVGPVGSELSNQSPIEEEETVNPTSEETPMSESDESNNNANANTDEINANFGKTTDRSREKSRSPLRRND